jgi:ubiquinone/menaquinone biosynthesis C-methylase UbiE
MGLMAAPNRGLALERYSRYADRYDRVARASRHMRQRAVEHLALAGGETVLDVACGTGLSFELIEERIGPDGRIIGIDLSPEMLSKAKERIQRHGWQNIELVAGAIEDVEIPVEADACLFVLTHDVMRSPQALENVVRHVKPGGRVATAGAKLAPWWAVPVNVVMGYQARKYITTFEGIKCPWSHLASLVPDLQVESMLLGGAYVAWGTVPPLSGNG